MYTIGSGKHTSWMRMCVIFLLSCAILFIAVSLFTYNSKDASAFYISTQLLPITNGGGVAGAHCAAFLMYCFGGASYILLSCLLFLLFIMVFGKSLRDQWERCLSLFFMSIAVAGLLSTYSMDFSLSPYPGGAVGVIFSQLLLRFFDPLGRTIFILISMMACMIICLRFSYVPLIHYARKVCAYIIDVVKRYKVVQRFCYGVQWCAYHGVVYPIMCLFDFVQSLFDGSAFNDTDLVVPEEREHKEEQNIFVQEDVQQENIVCENLAQYTASHKVLEDEQWEDKQLPDTPCNENEENQDQQSCDAIAQKTISQKVVAQKLYALPQLDIFIYEKDVQKDHNLENELQERAHILHDKLKRFGVTGEVVAIKRGPVVTLFEYQPDVDTKLSKIIALEDDLAMALQAMSIRILAPIPGRAVVGFEVANAQRHDVLFSQVVATPLYKNFSGTLPLVLGKGTIGEPVVVDLARMPHLLIAGSTGSGKSVALNALLISLLCKLDPDDLKLILIDPKRLEFAAFTDIAHLLFPIVTSPHHAAPVLRWVVQEMERRYEKMAEKGARNSADYNALLIHENHDSDHKHLPSIVVVIDELADLMITAGRDIEDLITRITQMARAAGIHMIVATQRPSVDVITGLIKANFPSRISFRVASRIDSRTILDTMGADRLLGRGDMLFLDASTSELRRVHGAYVSDNEIDSVVDHIRAQRKVEYLDIHKELGTQSKNASLECDPLYDEICLFLDEVDEVSISLIQRKFRIGYNRSARIIDILESQGLIMPQDGGKARKVIR